MTALGSKLYITQNGGLWLIDNLSTGHFTEIGPDGAWVDATSMTSLNGKLFIVQDSQLWSVDPATGAFTLRSRPHWDYSGPTVMAAVH